MEKVKIDFFTQNETEKNKGIGNNKKQMDVMAVAMKFMNDPKRLKRILTGAVLFLIIGFCSSIYFTIKYYNILIPIYSSILLFIYIYSQRNVIIEKIKNIFTKKNK